MAPLIEDLARRLDVSPAEARLRLEDAIDQLRAHAEREGQAALPGLGTLARAGDAWTFTPDETLVHAVNHSFAHLSPAGADGADGAVPDPPLASDLSEAEAPPSDTTPGAPPVAPLEEAASIFDRQDEDAGEPARGFFSEAGTAPPSQDDSPSRATSPNPEAAPSDAPERTPSPEKSPSSTKDPFSTGAHWTYAALPAGYLVRHAEPIAPGDISGARLQPLSPADLCRHVGLGEHLATTRTVESPSEILEPVDAQHRKQRRAPWGGNGMRWLAAVLVLAVLGLSAWYIFGQQEGSPVASEAPPLAQQEEAAGDPAPEAGSDASSSNDAGNDGASAGADASSGASGSEAGGAPESEQTSAGERAFAQAARLNRAQGGWTAVVASETSRFEAEQAAQRFAQRFEDRGYPIDILGTTVEDTQRFRVVVGQFSSADEVATVIQRGDGRFPEGAWVLEVDGG